MKRPPARRLHLAPLSTIASREVTLAILELAKAEAIVRFCERLGGRWINKSTRRANRRWANRLRMKLALLQKKLPLLDALNSRDSASKPPQMLGPCSLPCLSLAQQLPARLPLASSPAPGWRR